MKVLALVATLALSLTIQACGRAPAAAAVKEANGGTVNSLAGIVVQLFNSSHLSLATSTLGDALPAGADPFALSGWRTGGDEYEKTITSALGATLVTVRYKIAYQYGGSLAGKGQYLTGITFTPVAVDADPLWSVEAQAVSQKPTNAGTTTEPKAAIRFSVTLKARGLGNQQIVTDQFVLNGDGKLGAELQEFN